MELRAYCGIDCATCPAYVATQNDDTGLREKTAKEWSKMLNLDLCPEQINCHGCKSDLLFKYCQACKIKECSTKKGHELCGYCEEYSCERLDKFLEHLPEERKYLNKVNSSFGE